jgi:hypothetical protein
LPSPARPAILGSMGQEREDYREPGPTPPMRRLRIAICLLAAAALVGVGIAGAIAYVLARDHLAD